MGHAGRRRGDLLSVKENILHREDRAVLRGERERGAGLQSTATTSLRWPDSRCTFPPLHPRKHLEGSIELWKVLTRDLMQSFRDPPGIDELRRAFAGSR
jgi:hypothetical protein